MLVVAGAVPLGLAWWWSGRRSPGSRLRRGAGVFVACALAQLGAVTAAGVLLNDQYGFFADFGDLAGHSDRVQPIATNGIARPGQGRVTTITVHGRASATTAHVLVWLPPQYDRPGWRHHRFPVVEFLPGQPNFPNIDIQRFHLVADSMALIHRTGKPFVMVVPPIMIRPPKDTECTNVPGGPQALSWLTRDVPQAVGNHFRVQPPGPHWSMLGWSTGGFCAAKIMLTLPHDYAAAVGLGAYYQPDTHDVWPHLFSGSAGVRQRNSPQWLYHRHGLHGDHLLMIAGRQDPETWPSTRRMIRATEGAPGVGFVAFHHGGHNYRDYAAYVPEALRWLVRVGALG